MRKTGLREEESTIEIRAVERAWETQGKIYVVTALIEYLTVLLEYTDLLRPLAKWGPGQNAPVSPRLAALIEIEECNLLI